MSFLYCLPFVDWVLCFFLYDDLLVYLIGVLCTQEYSTSVMVTSINMGRNRAAPRANPRPPMSSGKPSHRRNEMKYHKLFLLLLLSLLMTFIVIIVVVVVLMMNIVNCLFVLIVYRHCWNPQVWGHFYNNNKLRPLQTRSPVPRCVRWNKCLPPASVISLYRIF